MKIKHKINRKNFIFVSVVALILISISYLSIPSIYDYEKLKAHIEKEVVNNFGMQVKIANEIKYSIIPSPRLIVNNIIIFNTTPSKEIISTKNKINIKLKYFNFFKKDQLEIEHIKINDAQFKLDYKKLESLNNFFQEKLEKRKIIINNSKIVVNDSDSKNIIFTINLEKINLFYKNNLNKIIFKTHIFNTKFNGISSKSFENNSKLNLQFFFPDLGINIKNFSENKSNKKIKKSIVSIPSGKLIFNYITNKKEIIIKESKFDSNLINGNFNGQIFKDPFYFSMNININKFNFYKFFSDKIFNSLDYKNLFQINKKINGNFLINIKNFNSNIFNSANLNLELKNGLIKINKIKLDINNNGYLEFKGFMQDEKVNLNSVLSIENTKKINSILSISKSQRVKKLNIISDAEFNYSKDYLKFSKIVFNNQTYSDEDLENINFYFNEYLDKNNFPEEFNIFKFRVLIDKILN